MPAREPRPIPSARYASLGDAAVYAGFSIRTLRRYISQGRLTGYRVGEQAIRVKLDDIDALFIAVPAADAS